MLDEKAELIGLIGKLLKDISELEREKKRKSLPQTFEC